MSFSIKKRRSKYIKTNFATDDFAPLSNEQLDIYCKALKNGDLSVITPITKGFIKLAIKIAGCYCYKPSSEQDMVSVALTALFEALLEVAHGRLNDDNLQGYLICRIHSKCSNAAANDALVRIPPSTKHKYKLKDYTIVSIPKMKGQKTTSLLELRDLIYSCCQSEREYIIIRLREHSYTIQEIAEQLDISTSLVSLDIQAVKRRFLKKEKDYA